MTNPHILFFVDIIVNDVVCQFSGKLLYWNKVFAIKTKNKIFGKMTSNEDLEVNLRSLGMMLHHKIIAGGQLTDFFTTRKFIVYFFISLGDICYFYDIFHKLK